MRISFEGYAPDSPWPGDTLNRNDAAAWGAHAARVQFSAARRELRASDFWRTVWLGRKWSDELFGEPPNSEGQRPALPIPMAAFRLRACLKM